MTRSDGRLVSLLPGGFRLVRTLAILIVLAALAAIGYWVGSLPTSSTRDPGPLYVPPEKLDFGTVWEQPDFTWKLPIRNTSDRDVVIRGFASSCSCQTIDPESLIVPAGTEKVITLHLDLRFFVSEDARKPVRDFRVALTPRLKPPDVVVGPWWIHGKVRSVMIAEPRILRLPQSIRNAPVKAGKVRLRPTLPIKGVEVLENKYVTAEVHAVEPTGEYRLEVYPRNDLAAGPFRTELKLRVTPRENRKLPLVSLQVFGSLIEDVEAIPPALALGRRTEGEVVTESLVLRSLSGRPFRVVGATPAYVRLKPISPNQAATTSAHHELQLEYPVTRAGSFQEFVKISVRFEEDERATTVQIPVICDAERRVRPKPRK